MAGEAGAGKIEPDAWRDQTWMWMDSHDISRTFEPDTKGRVSMRDQARFPEPAPSPLACRRHVSRPFQERQRGAEGLMHGPKRHVERCRHARGGASALCVPWAKAIRYQWVIEAVRDRRGSESGAKEAWRIEASAEKSITRRWGTRKSFHGRRCALCVTRHAQVPEYAGDSERLSACAHRAPASCAPDERSDFFRRGPRSSAAGFCESAHSASKPLAAGRLHRGMGCGRRRLTRRPPPSRLASSTRPPCASVISRANARPRPVPERLVE